MTGAVFFIVEYRLWIYGLLGLVAAFYANQFWQAHAALGRTPFGLERENARRRRNGALFTLILLVTLGFTVSLTGRYVAPALAAHPTPDPHAVPTPKSSPTPISNSTGPVVVDSSGCQNSKATLTDPEPNTRVSGSYEVRGTAAIDNFAFYKLEISGSGTNGLWVPVYVYTATVTGGPLGTFDASNYPAGNYAFRLVVSDNAGNSPFPCVIPITLVALGGGEPAPTPTP
jgi:hypothetical protein